jgi:hypothetical protein
VEWFAVKNPFNLPMHTARIPPEDPAPATTAAAFAMHTGQIIDFVSSYLSGVLYFPFDA